jgi:hypothetical protein
MAKWPVSTGSLIANVPLGIGVGGGEGLHICDKNEGVDKGNSKGGKRDDQGIEWQQYAMKVRVNSLLSAGSVCFYAEIYRE